MKPTFFKQSDASQIAKWAYLDDGRILQKPRYIENKTKYAIGVVKSGGISARSGSTAGSGSVEIYKAETAEASGTGRVVTAYNIDATTFSVGQYVAMLREYSTGKWVVVEPFVDTSCDCGTGDITVYAPGVGVTNTNTYNDTFGSTWTLSCDSTTYSDGDTISLTASRTWTDPLAPTGPLDLILLGYGTQSNYFLHQCSVTSSTATTSYSSVSRISEVLEVDPFSTGVTYSMDIDVSYSLDWSSAIPAYECYGYIGVLYLQVTQPFGIASRGMLYFYQC